MLGKKRVLKARPSTQVDLSRQHLCNRPDQQRQDKQRGQDKGLAVNVAVGTTEVGKSQGSQGNDVEPYHMLIRD